MLIADRAVKFQGLWKAVSDVPAPELAQFARWCIRFDDPLLERAIMKTGAKFYRDAAINGEQAHRYTTKLLLNLHSERESYTVTPTPEQAGAP